MPLIRVTVLLLDPVGGREYSSVMPRAQGMTYQLASAAATAKRALATV